MMGAGLDCLLRSLTALAGEGTLKEHCAALYPVVFEGFDRTIDDRTPLFTKILFNAHTVILMRVRVAMAKRKATHTEITTLLHGCYNLVIGLLQGCYKVVTRL